MKTVEVNTSKNYKVWIGSGLLQQTGDKISAVCKGKTALIVCDNIVNELYGSIVEQSLAKAGFTVSRFVFPNGEQSKNMQTYTSLLHTLAEKQLTRSDVIVALGGGVTGDLAGFAAATYLRGIAFAQIPTTLLAMVDSSVGGKTGVDLPMGKNIAGAFYQPDIVLCDTSTLNTLPQNVFNDGCAEMIKHGVILSKELFELLKKPFQMQKPLQLQQTEQAPALSTINEIIEMNVKIKRDIVVADEKETGIRQILNFGHTIGHSIEKNSAYSVSHGSAVAIGMVMASRGAYRLGLCTEDCSTEILEAVKRFKLPHQTSFTHQQLLEGALSDKKRSSQNITLILPEEIGKCKAKKFNLEELADFIRLGMQV